MNLEDYETRMVHDGKRNNREVKIQCELCGQDAWVRWQRVREGRGRFCSLECYNLVQIEEGKKIWGKENVSFLWDKTRQYWYAYWKDEETGKQKSTTKARFLWEQEHGELEANEIVTYIDGNPENCELDNLKVLSRSESNSIHLVGHEVSDETRKKIAIAHTGTEHWNGFVYDYRYPGFSKRLKKAVKKRDNYECQACGIDLTGSSRARIHHIDGNKKNPDLDNLILVCAACHSLIHSKKVVNEKILEFRSMLNS